MPAPIPTRDRNVYFIGAGLSCALRLPNTAGLLDGVLELAREKKRWGTSEKLPARLETAFTFFYPDAVHAGFRPDVVDFFSALRTYVDIGTGFAGGFKDAPDLYRSLKFAIAHLLIEISRCSACDCSEYVSMRRRSRRCRSEPTTSSFAFEPWSTGERLGNALRAAPMTFTW